MCERMARRVVGEPSGQVNECRRPPIHRDTRGTTASNFPSSLIYPRAPLVVPGRTSGRPVWTRATTDAGAKAPALQAGEGRKGAPAGKRCGRDRPGIARKCGGPARSPRPAAMTIVQALLVRTDGSASASRGAARAGTPSVASAVAAPRRSSGAGALEVALDPRLHPAIAREREREARALRNDRAGLRKLLERSARRRMSASLGAGGRPAWRRGGQEPRRAPRGPRRLAACRIAASDIGCRSSGACAIAWRRAGRGPHGDGADELADRRLRRTRRSRRHDGGRPPRPRWRPDRDPRRRGGEGPPFLPRPTTRALPHASGDVFAEAVVAARPEVAERVDAADRPGRGGCAAMARTASVRTMGSGSRRAASPRAGTVGRVRRRRVRRAPPAGARAGLVEERAAARLRVLRSHEGARTRRRASADRRRGEDARGGAEAQAATGDSSQGRVGAGGVVDSHAIGERAVEFVRARERVAYPIGRVGRAARSAARAPPPLGRATAASPLRERAGGLRARERLVQGAGRPARPRDAGEGGRR